MISFSPFFRLSRILQRAEKIKRSMTQTKTALSSRKAGKLRISLRTIQGKMSRMKPHLTSLQMTVMGKKLMKAARIALLLRIHRIQTMKILKAEKIVRKKNRAAKKAVLQEKRKKAKIQKKGKKPREMILPKIRRCKVPADQAAPKGSMSHLELWQMKHLFLRQ